MKNTFVCDESIMITIPIRRLKDAKNVQVMPEEFRCVYRDAFKVFAYNGKPKPVGATQATAGVFIVALGLIQSSFFGPPHIDIHTLPCLVYVVSGLLTYAAGQGPNMHLAKLSFSLNIVSFFWSLAALSLCGITFTWPPDQMYLGIKGVIIMLLLAELLIAIFLIYWLSKAVCREHFNTLPLILLKQVD